ncbi:MAG: hypothetical protein R6U37_00955 [Dehalococcoidia bacterium]
MGLFSRLKSVFGENKDAEKYAGIISAKEGKIVELEQEIAELKAKEEQIVLLQRELASLRETASKEDATIQAKEARIATLERTISTLKEKMEAAPTEPETKPEPEPKPAPKPQPPKPKPAVVKRSPAIDESKDKADDPYQQLGQDLIDAFKKTTRLEDDPSQEEG